MSTTVLSAAPTSADAIAMVAAGTHYDSVPSAMTTSPLERMHSMATKRRYELEVDRIRALYGHSLPARIRKRSATPPARLFHGTALQTWPLIEAGGLLPMGRRYVHLSVDRETALAVGRRKSDAPVILEIDACAAEAAGVDFYEGGDLVWLANRIPARYIAVDDDVRTLVGFDGVDGVESVQFSSVADTRRQRLIPGGGVTGYPNQVVVP